MLKLYIAKISDGVDLSQDEAEAAMRLIMTGQATDAQVGGYLVGLRMKGENRDEITGSARAMRSVALTIEPQIDGALLDTAGTGGDGANSINISTGAAFLIAGAGYAVAKHGNRAATSRCGSADVLEALGVNLAQSPEQVTRCIEEVGVGFMFAPLFHPAMKHAIGPRRELGQRTIFNLLGPLTNPARSSHQLIGVYDPALTEVIAEVLDQLGVSGAMVVHGRGGLDELSTDGPNRVSELRDGNILNYELDPGDLGLRKAGLGTLAGGEPAENAKRLRQILANEDVSPCKDVLILNAGAALAMVMGGLSEGVAVAREALESGKAMEKLNALVSFSQASA